MVTTLFISTTEDSEIELEANIFPNPSSHNSEEFAPANAELRWIEIYNLIGKKITKYSG